MLVTAGDGSSSSSGGGGGSISDKAAVSGDRKQRWKEGSYCEVAAAATVMASNAAAAHPGPRPDGKPRAAAAAGGMQAGAPFGNALMPGPAVYH